jgi:hypothetical protein
MFEIFRSVIPDGGQHKGTSPCKAKGCERSTREAKPYCSDHIERAPYVAHILEILAARDEEEAKLEAGSGGIPKQGFFYKETLLLLRSKNFTAKGLSRRLDITHRAAERLIDLMHEDKLALRKFTKRGDMTISGLGPRDLASDQE